MSASVSEIKHRLEGLEVSTATQGLVGEERYKELLRRLNDYELKAKRESVDNASPSESANPSSRMRQKINEAKQVSREQEEEDERGPISHSEANRKMEIREKRHDGKDEQDEEENMFRFDVGVNMDDDSDESEGEDKDNDADYADDRDDAEVSGDYVETLPYDNSGIRLNGNDMMVAGARRHSQNSILTATTTTNSGSNASSSNSDKYSDRHESVRLSSIEALRTSNMTENSIHEENIHQNSILPSYTTSNNMPPRMVPLPPDKKEEKKGQKQVSQEPSDKLTKKTGENDKKNKEGKEEKGNEGMGMKVLDPSSSVLVPPEDTSAPVPADEEKCSCSVSPPGAKARTNIKTERKTEASTNMVPKPKSSKSPKKHTKSMSRPDDDSDDDDGDENDGSNTDDDEADDSQISQIRELRSQARMLEGLGDKPISSLLLPPVSLLFPPIPFHLSPPHLDSLTTPRSHLNHILITFSHPAFFRILFLYFVK